MSPVVRSYHEYRRSADAWALGRLIVPALRLVEFERAAAAVLQDGASQEPWRLSALVGDDIAADLARIRVFNDRSRTSTSVLALVDTVEIKVRFPAEVAETAEMVGDSLTRFFEVPITSDPCHLLHAIGRAGARAKVRTGGVIPELVPKASDLLRFLSACAELGIPFKATAGLHHALRGLYPLTYEPRSESATLFGFLNVFLCSAFLRAGMGNTDAAALLQESEKAALHFEDDAIVWREHCLDPAQIANAREHAVSFGSCSFREPIDELHEIHPLTADR